MNDDYISKLPYDVSKLKQISTREQLIELHPEFSIFPEFSKEVGFKYGHAVALIVMLYSKNTYLSAKLSANKINSALYLGYKQNAGVITSQSVHNALMGTNKVFNDMIIRYCRMQYDSDFAELVIFNNAYYNQLTALNDGKSENAEKTKDVISNVNILKKQKNDIEAKILNDNTTRENLNALYEHVEYVALGLRPEDVAAKLNVGEVPVDVTPYGRGYSFEKYGERERMYIEPPITDDEAEE